MQKYPKITEILLVGIKGIKGVLKGERQANRQRMTKILKKDHV